MKFPIRTARAKTDALIFIFAVLLTTANANNWPKLFEESTGLEAEQIDPESGAENLIRWIEINDSDPTDSYYSYYYRVKVFNERGVDDLKLINLEGSFGGKLRRVQARVTYPDGRIEDIENDTIIEKERFRVGRISSETASFAPPQLEPGCVIDYRWTLSERGWANGYQLLTRVNRPTHTLVFRMKFYPERNQAWTSDGFDRSSFEETQASNYRQVILNDLPSAPDEDFLPPPNQIQPWMTVFYYLTAGKDWIDDFWDMFASGLHKDYRKYARPKHKLIRQKASELIAGESDNEEQLRNIYEFCQKEIINIYDPIHGYSSDEQEKMEDRISHAVDVMEKGYGNYWQINYLFASLAEAGGLDARLVRLSNRSRSQFSKDMAYYRSLPDSAIAIKLDKAADWRVFAPGNRFLGFGKTRYSNEMAMGLLSSPKGAAFITTPLSPARSNWVQRVGDLTIDANGNLSGRVTLASSGHYASIYRSAFEDLSEEDLIDRLEDEFDEQFANFEINNIEVNAQRDTSQSFKIFFDINVEGYADYTPTRLFIVPSFFQKGRSQLFEETEREFDIEYSFLETVRDKVTIKLPSGYTLDLPEFATGVLNQDYMKHQISIDYDEEQNALQYIRNFELHTYSFPNEHYEAVRKIYEGIYDQDNQLLTLQKSEVAEAPADENKTDALSSL